MSVISGVVTAICSLSTCFPAGINVNTTIKGGFLHTFDVGLAYPAQSINVALDLSSSNFWLFGGDAPNKTLTSQFKGGVFDLSATTQIYIPTQPIVQTAYYNQWVYNDAFGVEVEQVRTSLQIGGVSFGIPYIGINKNYSQLTEFIVQSSGLFGIQRNAYANSIPMQANYDSIITLYTPRLPKTNGRLLTGNQSITECGTNFTYYKLVGSNTNVTSYFAFTSPQQSNKQVVISTTSSYLTVDSDTFSMLRKKLKPVLMDRKKEFPKNRPNRRHELVECGSRKNAPILTIGDPSIGLLKLEGKDYIKRTRSGYCIFKVREQTAKNQQWVLSYPFLQKYCIQINLYANKIGFAVSKH